jgi:hypothetical protein
MDGTATSCPSFHFVSKPLAACAPDWLLEAVTTIGAERKIVTLRCEFTNHLEHVKS